MKFFKQTINRSCNIVAIQQTLACYDKYPSVEEIKRDLPDHEFGSWLSEIGTYFEKSNIKTKLISNSNNFISTNNHFIKALNDYKKKGFFEDRLPEESDIKKSPVIVNVDTLKIKKEEGIPGAHYVVLRKEEDVYYFYDGNNFDDKVITTFDEIYKTSININEFHENGMWLILD